MPDFIGNISVPEQTPSGTFPVRVDWGWVHKREPKVERFLFRSGNRKIEQAYVVGSGAPIYTVGRAKVSAIERASLESFWLARQGPYQPFTWNKPIFAGTSTTPVTVRFAQDMMSLEMVTNCLAASTLELAEHPTTTPAWTISATDTRFPSAGLQTALLPGVQKLVPVVKIEPRLAGYPAIYLSNQRFTLGGTLYHARLLENPVVTQTIGWAQDTVRFTFGNADRVMSDLAADVNLRRAWISLGYYHVDSQILCNFWRGMIVHWAWNDAQPTFTIDATDGFDLSLMFPTRVFSRHCWKIFNDGVNCPFATQGALDLVHFPSASAASCDYGYDTDNGCLAHQMGRWHGGVPAKPQGVMVRNTLPGVFGHGRSPLSYVSIVGETIFGQVIPEIFTDTPMKAPGFIAAGRDESEYYNALIAVCEGPIGAYASGHQLDKQFHHGYPGSFGLREVLGTDPAGVDDYFSLGQVGDQTGGDWRKVYLGNQTYARDYAAGIAFIELRRKDQKDIQPSLPESHEADVWIGLGKQGWVWTAPGARTKTTISNPIWAICYAYLKCMGVADSDITTAEQLIDIPSAVAAAAICDTNVVKLVGSGNETQFKFRGFFTEQKPLADWIREMLDTCLGYRTRSFGRLRFGIRINSSVVENFGEGNIIEGSAQPEILQPEFNVLRANFSNEDYEYKADVVELKDQDDVIANGTRQPGQMNLMAVTSRSQALRIIGTRIREELGGVTAEERKKACRYRFRTTMLALNVEPGMIIGVTHPTVPGGSGEFRVESIRWNSDFSIDMECKTTTDSMYNLAVGPKPVDALPEPVPVEVFDYPRRPACTALSRSTTDPIVSADQFVPGVAEVYETTLTGNVEGRIQVTFFVPRNRFLQVPATSILGITWFGTGGLLPADRNYFIQVAPYQGLNLGPPSNVRAVAIGAGADTGRVVLDPVQWPVPPSGSWDGYKILAGHTEQSIVECVQVVTGSLPSTVEFSGPMRHFGSSSASPNFVSAIARAYLEPHPGVMRAKVSAVTTTTITCDDLAGGGDAFGGRKLSVLNNLADGPALGVVPLMSFSCTSYDQSTGTFTVAEDPVAKGVVAGDMLVVRTSPSGTSTTVTDPLWPLPPDELVGKKVRILYGKGFGQERFIAANTATTITVDLPWNTIPDSTSIVVVVETEAAGEIPTAEIYNDSGQSVAALIPFTYVDVPVMVKVYGVDKFGQLAPDEASPARDLFFRGEAFVKEVAADYTLNPNDRYILADTTAGAVTLTFPPTKNGRGRVVVKHKAGSNSLSLAAAGTETIEVTTVDGQATVFPRAADETWYSEASGGGGAGGGGGITTKTVNLADGPGTTTISESVVDGDLVVRIIQSAVGGREIAWSADFLTGTSVDIDLRPDAQTIVRFTRFGSGWVETGARVRPVHEA